MSKIAKKYGFTITMWGDMFLRVLDEKNNDYYADVEITDEVKNTFRSSYVACDVIENGMDGTSDFDGAVKTNVRVKNIGEVQSYIRAAVVVTWMSENGKTVTAQKPVDGVDYELLYYTPKGTDTHFTRGVTAFWSHGDMVLVADIACADTLELDLTKTMTEFLRGFHYV